MIARQAKRNGKDLPPLFWNQTAWKRAYLLQILKANALLKIFSQKAIFAALRRARFVLSLNNKMVLDPILLEEQEKLDAQAAAAAATPPSPPPPPAPKVTTRPREVYNPNKSQLAKLRELDG